MTKLGREAAESMVRRHRLAELLVVDVLEVDLFNAHEEAHRLEHAISPLLEEKIRRRLGNPKTSPFGDPIPGSGNLASHNSVSLSEAKQDHEYTVDRIPEDDQALLEYLVPYGFIPGRRVKLTEAAGLPRGYQAGMQWRGSRGGLRSCRANLAAPYGLERGAPNPASESVKAARFRFSNGQRQDRHDSRNSLTSP